MKQKLMDWGKKMSQSGRCCQSKPNQLLNYYHLWLPQQHKSNTQHLIISNKNRMSEGIPSLM